MKRLSHILKVSKMSNMFGSARYSFILRYIKRIVFLLLIFFGFCVQLQMDVMLLCKE